MSAKRNAYTANCCLSLNKSSQIVQFVASNHSKIGDVSWDKAARGRLSQCFSLYSLLVALDQKDINFFSLDVDGHELDILKTIPFDKVKIDVFTVEYAAWPDPESVHLQKLKGLREFFASLGNYKEVNVIEGDVLFQRQN